MRDCRVCADFQIPVFEVILVSVQVRLHRLGRNMGICTYGEFELH